MDVGLTKKMTFVQNQESEPHRFRRRSLGRQREKPAKKPYTAMMIADSQMSSCGLSLSNMADSRFSGFSGFVGSGMSDRTERKREVSETRRSTVERQSTGS